MKHIDAVQVLTTCPCCRDKADTEQAILPYKPGYMCQSHRELWWKAWGRVEGLAATDHARSKPKPASAASAGVSAVPGKHNMKQTTGEKVRTYAIKVRQYRSGGKGR